MPLLLKNIVRSQKHMKLKMNMEELLRQAKEMQKNKKGHVVFISSPAGYQGLPGGGFYGVTKSALTFLAETLNIEFHKSNIKVQVVNPGFVKTPMTDQNPFFMPFLMTPQSLSLIHI